MIKVNGESDITSKRIKNFNSGNIVHFPSEDFFINMTKEAREVVEYYIKYSYLSGVLHGSMDSSLAKKSMDIMYKDEYEMEKCAI